MNSQAQPKFVALMAAFFLTVTLAFAKPGDQPPMNPSFEADELPPDSTYEQLWAAVDSANTQGLPATALSRTESILNKARTENNEPQKMKALLNIFLNIRSIEDQAVPIIIRRIDEELATARGVSRSLLLKSRADYLLMYYRENQWELDLLSALAQNDDPDFLKWGGTEFVTQVMKLYDQSITNEAELIAAPLEKWKPVMEYSEGTPLHFSTLFDLLAWQVASKIENLDGELIEPVNPFLLNQAGAWLPSPQFVNEVFTSSDSLSVEWQVIRLWQRIERAHLSDSDPSALVHAQLDRLNFVRRKGVMDDAEAQWMKAVQALIQTHQQHAASVEVIASLAQHYVSDGEVFNQFSGTGNADSYKKALALCESAVQKWPEAPFITDCKNLIQRIKAREISLSCKEQVASGTVFPVNVKWRNSEDIYLRLVKVDEKFFRIMNDYSLENNEKWEKFRAVKSLREWKVTPPAQADYNKHVTHVPVEGLPQGNYAILVSLGPGFDPDSFPSVIETFWVSNLALMSRGMDQPGQEKNVEFFVTHVVTGLPLKGAKIKLYKENYAIFHDPSTLITTLTTDAGGRAVFSPKLPDFTNYGIEVTLGKDRLSRDNGYYRPYAKYNPPAQMTTHLLLDRKIFRPGQTVYFKGVITLEDKETEKVRPVINQKQTVKLLDANRLEVASLEVKTNEFGSYQGSFTIPTGRLTGQWMISDGRGYISFSVEEYRRPKFEVKMDPVKGSYKPNEQVKVTGSALAYSGASMEGNTVRYRVVRVANYPYWCWEWGRIPSYGEEMEIANGETKTGAGGQFEIEFTAVPDLSLDPKTQPTFTYQVFADVTDGTGETQSAKAEVAVSYVALNLTATLTGEVEREKTKYFRVKTTNTNGEFIPAKGTAQVWRLKGPAFPLEKIDWQKADAPLLNEAEWRKQFPTLAWDDDNNPQTWPKEASVLNVNFDTEQSDSVVLTGMDSWREGTYLIEVKANDAFGTPVRYLETFQVYSFANKAAPAYNPLWVKAQEDRVSQGGLFKFCIASPYPKARALLTIATENKLARREWISLNGKKQFFTLPADLPPGHHYVVNVILCVNGSFHNESANLYVKALPSHLNLEVETFRDKVEPGSQETWSLKIKGPGGEKVAAELAATLYDQSLDALGGGNSWYLRNLVDFYYSMPYWNLTELNSVGYRAEGDPLNQDRLSPYQLNWWRLIGMVDETTFSFDNAMFFNSSAPDDFGGFESLEESEISNDLKVGGRSVVTRNINGNTQSEFQNAENEDDGLDGKAQKGGSSIRSNLKETAFFFPQLRTDAEGAIVLRFTMPEALTRWKFMALAHTEDMKVGTVQKTTVTQKDLMIQPFLPRFLREGDKVVLTAKVSNLTDGVMNGEATLELFDAFSMTPVDVAFANTANIRSFTIQNKGSETVKWEITVPAGVQALICRMKARSGKFTDGEESPLPVLTNRMLLTEALPMAVRAGQTKSFTFTKLISQQSPTLRHERLTLEFTSNPAWQAVQALPYLMEYPYECQEQTFSRYYANALAAHIAGSHPRIKQVFDQWAAGGNNKEALLSNLEKNQELKSLLLEETPWVMQAQDESERKKRIALLFDLNRMASESEKALGKLSQNQNTNGAWSWFAGGPDDRYITQHIATGLGKLQHLGVKMEIGNTANKIAFNAVKFLDGAIERDYQELKRQNADLKAHQLGNTQVHYLYMRSFYDSTFTMASSTSEGRSYYEGQARKYWLKHSKMEQAMIAIALHRSGDKVTPAAILKSLKEFSMKTEELGAFWKENVGGYYWWQAPVEFQAMMIEAFDEAGKDPAFVDEMKLWLLKSKQTTDWKTTRATVEACYALLLRGTDFLAETRMASISLGGQTVDPAASGGPEVGTGYFKTNWSGSDITPEMGRVTVTNPNKVVSWGALYWQYFEQLDKITPAATPLKIEKALYLKRNTPNGPVLDPITAQTTLKPGDRIAVRLVISTDRDLEYVHLKDLRASGLEPVNVLSQYKWAHGLGFYEATRDAATHFFISWLPRGSHPFEYELVVSHTGDFSNGLTTIQCMYAPEFTAHSEGIRLKVRE